MEFAAADPAPDALLISRQLERAIGQVVRALPRKLRDPFLLAASGDHRYEEIAALVGAPIGTVKWRISEARRLIRINPGRGRSHERTLIDALSVVMPDWQERHAPDLGIALADQRSALPIQNDRLP